MKTINDFSVGDKVLFGRGQGEKTLGEVVKVNRTKLKVKQLEERGTHRNYPVGTVWTVPPSLCEHQGGSQTSNPSPVVPSRPVRKSPRELLAEKGIKRGDRVEFSFRGSRMTGRIDRINVKRVTIMDVSDPRYSGGVYCNPSSILRKVEDAAPAPKVNVRVGQAVSYEGKSFNWNTGRYDDGSNRAVVTKVDHAAGTVEVFAHFNRTPLSADLVTPVTRTELEIMQDIESAYCGLSPENLHCDGEASRTHVRREGARLNRALKALFKELGREVNEGESYHYLQAQKVV
jgi:hypothetical protein